MLRCNPYEGARPSLRLAPCLERKAIAFILFRYVRFAALVLDARQTKSASLSFDR